MLRFLAWAGKNVDGLLGLALATVVGLLGLADVVETPAINNATLLILALISATILRDRWRQGAAEEEVRDTLRTTSTALARLPDQLERIGAVEGLVTGTRAALESASMVRVLSGPELGHVFAQARRDTERWLFKGGTGTYTRAVTLPECVANARRDKRALHVRLEIIDPTDEAVCDNYSRFRRSLSEDRGDGGEPWTLDRTRKESFATILAACWHRERFRFLDIQVALSSVMTTLRWDLSSHAVVITQEDPRVPALMIERGKVYYDCFSTELLASFEQAGRVPLEQAFAVSLRDEPTVDEVRRLFTKLDLHLPTGFTDRDVVDIIRKAIQPRNPYA